MKKYIVEVFEMPEVCIVSAKNKKDAFYKAVDEFRDEKTMMHVVVRERVVDDKHDFYSNLKRID
jgi:hypothetical protein